MPGDESFYPPVQYSPIWFLLGIGIIVLVIAWYVVVALITRKRARPQSNFQYGPPILTPSTRERYIGFIDTVYQRYSSGTIAYAEAHHELSGVIRTFAAEARGVRAPYMTLEDLRNARQEPLADAVETLYPGAFSGLESGPVDVAVERARRLVSEWK